LPHLAQSSFHRSNPAWAVSRAVSLVPMYASRFRNCVCTERNRIGGARKKWGAKSRGGPCGARLRRRGMNPMQAAIQAGYSESTARTHVYSWPETAEARAEILQALNGVGTDQHFLAKHLKRRTAKGDVRAMALAGRWRGYDRAWALDPRWLRFEGPVPLQVSSQ
jgi:hypothetical protein